MRPATLTMTSIAAVSGLLLLLPLVAVAHDDAGDWTRPLIENVTFAPSFDETHILYARFDATSAAWTDFNFTQRAARQPVARVERTKNVEGWEHIAISSVNDTDAWYTAGFAEGFLTYDDIYSTYVDQVKESYDEMQNMPDALDFVQKHVAFERNHEKTTAFGRQLHNQMRLIDGMAAGFAAAFDRYRPTNMTRLDSLQIYCVSFMEGITNVLDKYYEQAMAYRASPAYRALNQPRRDAPPVSSPGARHPLKSNRLHCSAMMRLVGGDFFFAHDTWSSFNTMLRQLKSYSIGGSKVIMSGYAGSFSSIDDFYMTSKHLAVTETTNGFFNESLYDEIVPDLVSEFHRVMIANFLATTPAEWVTLFSQENSGTYNNQYMVAHMKVIRDALRGGAKTIPTGSFYVAEQIPGLIVAHDQTAFVNQHGYWPSYNVPYYPEIYNRSGFLPYDTPQDWGMNDYHDYPRARIMKRMYPLVKDSATMFYAMRFNNWRQDHDSTIPWCHTSWNTRGVMSCTNGTQGASLAIASRYDLNPRSVPVPPGGKVGPGVRLGMFGAIDTKMTSALWMGDGEFKLVAVNGPTRVQNPVFDREEWIAANPTSSYVHDPWRGVANRFDFAPVMFRDSESPTTGPPSGGPGDNDGSKHSTGRDVGIAFGVIAGICVVGLAGGFAARRLSRSRHALDEGSTLV